MPTISRLICPACPALSSAPTLRRSTLAIRHPRWLSGSVFRGCSPLKPIAIDKTAFSCFIESYRIESRMSVRGKHHARRSCTRISIGLTHRAADEDGLLILEVTFLCALCLSPGAVQSAVECAEMSAGIMRLVPSRPERSLKPRPELVILTLSPFAGSRAKRWVAGAMCLARRNASPAPDHHPIISRDKKNYIVIPPCPNVYRNIRGSPIFICTEDRCGLHHLSRLVPWRCLRGATSHN